MGRIFFYLLDLVMVVLVARILDLILQRLLGGPKKSFWGRLGTASPRNDAQTVRGETARDPVCGMFVATELSHRLTEGRQTLHFCSRECLERYQKSRG